MTEAREDYSVSDLLNLTGKTILVTGASGNIGRGIARRLAEAGATIVAHYHKSRSAAEALAEEVSSSSVKASVVQADLRSESDVKKMMQVVYDSASRLDGVVNNAARQSTCALEDMSGTTWRDMLSANLDGAFMVARFAAERMRQTKIEGAIVNIASITGADPSAGHAHYAASKAGLIMLTRSLALEYGRDGIRSNAVSPGLIDRDQLAKNWPEGVSSWLEHVPLGRLGLPADVADAVLFLMSPAARWINGINLVVDGGMSSVSRW